MVWGYTVIGIISALWAVFMPSSFGTFLYISYKGKACEALIYKGSRQKIELFSPIKVLNPADMVVFVNF